MPADRALVLDFGGVITRTLFETHPMTEAALGLAPGSLTWRGPFAPQTDPLWQDMQAGRIAERGYWGERTRQVAALIGADWHEMSDFVRAAIRAARAAGCRLAILSNELDLFYGADFRDRLPLLAHFDVIVDATHTGILKPDPRAYRDCIDRLGLPAGACVFVDDQPRNVAGAAAAGMVAAHFDVNAPGASLDSALGALHSLKGAGS